MACAIQVCKKAGNMAEAGKVLQMCTQERGGGYTSVKSSSVFSMDENVPSASIYAYDHSSVQQI